MENLIFDFVDHIKDGIQVSDINGDICYMNSISKERLGIANIEGVNVRDFEPLFSKLSNWNKHLIQLRENEFLTIRSVNKNLLSGKTTPVEVTIFIKKFKGKEYIFATSKDITNFLNTEIQLERREQMLKAIANSTKTLSFGLDFYDSISKSLSIIGDAVKVDRTYLFEFHNGPKDEKLFSQRLEWNSGLAVPQINNPELQNLPVKMFEEFMYSMHQNIPFQAIVSELPDASLTKTTLTSQGILTVLIMPIYHKRRLWGMVGYDDCQQKRIWNYAEISILSTFSSNISLSIERQESLKEVKSLAAFPLQSPEPIIRLNLKGEVILRNYYSQEIEEKTLKINNKEWIKFDTLCDLIKNDVLINQEQSYYEIKTEDQKYYSIIPKYINDHDYINLYFNNITEQKKNHQKIREAQKLAEESNALKELFIINMSHEIRTPLNAIIGLSHQLKQFQQEKKGKEYIDHIITSGNHLQSLIDNILDFSKINAGKLELKETSFDLRIIYNEIRTILDPLAKEKGLIFNCYLEETIYPYIYADRTRIKQILINVISNSIKFTENGEINFQIKSKHDTNSQQILDIMVQDTGVGMSKSFIKKIFDKFSQADNSSIRKEPGTGLGMPITQELLNMMKGTIGVESKLNKGTIIKIEIPVKYDYNFNVNEKYRQIGCSNLKNKNVLIVEDNELNLLVTKGILNRYEINIYEAVNGIEAIKLIDHLEIKLDLILMDIQMPFKDGIETTKILIQERNIQTPIIALSANAFKDEIDKCFSAGMVDYLTKPFKEDELVNLMQKHIFKEKQIENNGKNNKTQVLKDESLFNLDVLKIIHSQNEKNLLLKTFINESENCINSLSEANINRDRKEVTFFAHKLKSSFKLFKVQSLYKSLEFLEKEELNFSDNETSKEIRKIKEVFLVIKNDINKILGV